jgi:hypothetical protein
MVEIQQSKDTCIDHLTVTQGKELEIMANLQSVGQIDAIIEGHVCKFFGSAYGWDKSETLLRSSISFKARGRDDLAGIGKTPDTVPGFQNRPEL